jgi:hypothetical protein
MGIVISEITMTIPSDTRPGGKNPSQKKTVDATGEASKPSLPKTTPDGATPSGSERTYHPDTTARPTPSGANPMEYRRPHPEGKPVRDDQSADPPHDEEIHPASKR